MGQACQACQAFKRRSTKQNPRCNISASGTEGLIQRDRRTLKNVIGRFTVQLRQAVFGSPELFLPVFLLLTWKITAIASTTRPLILALLLTGMLVLYGVAVHDGDM